MKSKAAEADAAKLETGVRVKKNHIRKGSVGSWAKYFSPGQTAAFLTKTARHLAGVPDMMPGAAIP